MSTVILACSSLKAYVDAAQRINRTNYPVIYLDRKYHTEPSQMRQLIIEEEQKLSPDIDTVLVAMGFCGGSWDQVVFSRRTVIPRVDDCISLFLQKTDAYIPNLKETGHMYMADIDPNDFDMEKLFRDTPSDEYDGISKEALFHMYFDSYHDLDVVDTGLNDCYSEEYVEQAQKNADTMNLTLGFVEGSNHLLEKLIGGIWDVQFLVAEKGHLIRHADFF